jgi:hypothetical protein
VYIYDLPTRVNNVRTTRLMAFNRTASDYPTMPQQAKQIPKQKAALVTEKVLIVWVALDEDPELFSAKKKLSSNVHWSRDYNTEGSPWLKHTSVHRVQQALGYDYAFVSATDLAFQQGVLTAEILRLKYDYRIEYQDSLAAALRYLSPLTHTGKKRVLVWLDVHQEVKPSTWAFAYDALAHECGRIFPPREEIIWADSKTYDILAFDEMAADEDYRPRTCCFGPGEHNCLFPSDDMSVLKRSHSCGNAHVMILSGKDQVEKERKEMEKSRENHVDDNTPGWYYRWMHQQYVSTLVDFGEFRVFIATKTGNGKAREPYVVSVIHTQWTKPIPKRPQRKSNKQCSADKVGQEFLARKVEPNEQWSQYPLIHYNDLTRFALKVYRQLQHAGGQGFKSLDVGGRLDIGVAPSGKQFFVNELTRWYGAHHFALNTQLSPGDAICRAYTKAFAETLEKGDESRD